MKFTRRPSHDQHVINSLTGLGIAIAQKPYLIDDEWTDNENNQEEWKRINDQIINLVKKWLKDKPILFVNTVLNREAIKKPGEITGLLSDEIWKAAIGIIWEQYDKLRSGWEPPRLSKKGNTYWQEPETGTFLLLVGKKATGITIALIQDKSPDTELVSWKWNAYYASIDSTEERDIAIASTLDEARQASESYYYEELQQP